LTYSVHLQNKKLRQYFYCRSRFSALQQSLFAHRAGAKKDTIPVGLLTYVSNDDLSAFSGFLPMTDFHQRQAISTLTAPAARGLSPHYLVQPGTRHALYPATGTLIHLT
jgi:hypothetical protein